MRSKRNRLPIIALLCANAVSQLGNVLSFLAIPWFVLETTGSASKTGLAVAMSSIPVVIVGLFGGAIVDRLGFRRTSIFADIASGLTVVMIPLLFLTVGLEFWQLLTLIFLGALLDMPGITARRSIYPDLAQLGGYQLERANAAYQMVNRMALLLGPPLAGFLIALIGPSNVLWFTGVTFAMSSLVVAGGVSSHLHFSQKADDAPPTRYAREVLEGFRFIWDDRTIFWMIMVLSVGSLLAEPLYTVVLPVYAREVFGSAVSLGIVFAGLAAGALAGNLFYAYRGYRLPRRTLFIGGFAARAALFWMIATQPSVVVLTVIMFLSGIVLEPVNPIQMTIMQERVPSTMRGRVFAASSAVAIGTMPIGMIGYGYLIEWVGLQTTLVVLASVNLALPMAMLAIPALREMEKPVESGLAVSEPVA